MLKSLEISKYHVARPSIRVYGLITGDEDARVCRDIPESACRHQPENFLKHLLSSAATKIGDELASAKLVLPWLLAALALAGALSALKLKEVE